MIEPKQFEKILLDRRTQLQQRLHNIEIELDQPGDPDVEERATEREGDEVLEGVGQAGLNELRAIDAALKRIEDGTYGQCISCGGNISVQRLTAVPYAVKCRTCAA
jgi:RNA polymerase-binding transcription factor DksA